MAHTFQIVYGSTTISLTVAEYRMVTPALNANYVKERMIITVTGTSKSDLQTNIQALSLADNQVRARQQTQRGNRVYLVITPDGYSTAYRSEIYDLQIDLQDAALDWQWVALHMDIELQITRAPYWEDNTERQIALTNGNGTDVLTALRVFNCNDGLGSSPSVHNNWVEIPAANVSGDLPAPVRLSCVAYMGTSVGIKEMFIGVDKQPGVEFSQKYYEGETGTGDTTVGNMSDGKYHAYPTDGSGNATITKTIATSYVSLETPSLKQLVRMSIPSTGGYYQYVQLLPNGTYIYGPKIYLSNGVVGGFYLYDMGNMAVPPGYFGNIAYGDIQCGIKLTGGAISSYVNVDYWQFLPSDNGFINVVFQSGIQNGYTLEVNELEKIAYEKDISAYIHALGDRRGNQLVVYPEKRQRIRFLWNSINVSTLTKLNNVTESIGVMAYYRPRRRTL